MRAQRNEDLRSRSPPYRARTRDRRQYSPPRRENEDNRLRYPPPRRENEDNRRQYPPPRRENEDNRLLYLPPRHEDEDNRRRLRYDVSSPKTVPPLSEPGGGRSRADLDGEKGGYCGGGSGEKRDLDDRQFDAQLQKHLSGFNEGLPHRDSPSMKFQWKYLLDEQSNSGGNGVNHSLNNHSTSYGSVGADNTRISTEREYQGSRSSDVGRHEKGVTYTKPMSLEIYRAGGALLTSYHPDADIGKGCSVQLNEKLQSTMTNSNIGVHHDDDEELSIRDTLRRNESTRRELFYKNYENPMLMNDKSHYTTPSHLQNYECASVSSGITKDNFLGFHGDGLQISSDGSIMSCGMVGEPVGHGGYARPTFNSSINPELQLKDAMNHGYPHYSLTEANLRDYAYPEVDKTEKWDLGTLTGEICGKRTSVQEGYDYQDRSRADIMDPILGRVNDTQGFHGDHLRQNKVFEGYQSLQKEPGAFEDHCSLQEQPGVFEDHRFLQERPGVFKDGRSLQEQPVPDDYHDMSGVQPALDFHDMSGASHPLKHNGDMWGSRITDHQFETEQYQGHESLDETKNYRDHKGLPETQIYGDHESSQMGGDYAIGSADVPWFYDENLSRLPMSDYAAGQHGMGDYTHGSSTTEELGLPDPSENMLKRKRGVDKNMSRRKPRGQLLSHTNIHGSIFDLTNGNEQLQGEDIDNLHLPNKSRHSQNRKVSRSSSEMARRQTYSYGDWLSSCNLPTTLRMRLSKPYTSADRDIKKRLRPCPQNNLNTSSLKNQSFKFEKNRHDGFLGSPDPQAGNPSEAKVVPSKINLPEDSEDFKQLVNIAFLKFVKQLYGSPAQRRIYLEQGKAGKLKCSICVSISVFVDTKSLAMHSFNSLKVGFRSQHLGFHKALCVLMGWNSAVSPNCSRVSLVLPKAEALALKEDLVIWPPVVIIHNSSIGNNDPDKRMIVTIEVLETILRDMGFGGERIKVCRGKPANQSILVVRFKGTFSGLREAEKLHKLYAESTHGRSEFQQISSDNGNNSKVQNRLADKVEHALYGYLGIAEDLDKLDFETKKRSLVKSKKEIQAIADASLRTE